MLGCFEKGRLLRWRPSPIRGWASADSSGSAAAARRDDNDTVLQLVVVDLAEYRSNEDDRRLMAAVGIRERAEFRIYVHSGGACKRSRMTTNA